MAESNSGWEDLPISPRIVQQQSKATIKTILDALIELVTNSYDSYERLSRSGRPTGGKIISISCRSPRTNTSGTLQVEDRAEGMRSNRIREVLEFAGELSGFQSGASVRGLFGKGLKEAIVALGKGEIS